MKYTNQKLNPGMFVTIKKEYGSSIFEEHIFYEIACIGSSGNVILHTGTKNGWPASNNRHFVYPEHLKCNPKNLYWSINPRYLDKIQYHENYEIY